LHPNRISAVAGLSVPYATRAPIAPIALYEQRFAGKFLYQLYFQEEGVGEAELEADIGTSLRKIYYSISGDAPSLDPWLNRPTGGGLLDALTDPDPFPAWLSNEDLDYLVSQFSISGFRGPLNRYRNQDRDYNQLPQIGVAPITQPACFIAGSKDLVRHFNPGHDAFANMEKNFDDLRINEIIPGKGHWIQQEAPDPVNDKLLEFLSSLSDS
jgi:pimeloyl-ACP methyl ester carboxylesterase